MLLYVPQGHTAPTPPATCSELHTLVMERASAHIQRLPPNMVAQVSRIHKGTEWTAAVVWPYRSCPTCHSKCVTPLADCHRQSCVLPAVQVQASDRFALIFLGRHLGDCVWVWTAHRQDGSGVPFAELRPFDRQARLGERKAVVLPSALPCMHMPHTCAAGA